jgi:hypothetical protein
MGGATILTAYLLARRETSQSTTTLEREISPATLH